MPDQVELNITIENVLPAESNLRLGELEMWLHEHAPSVQQERKKPNALTQDAGTILAVVLGSSSAIVLFKGLSVLVARWGNSLRITTRDGEVVARGDAVKQIDPTAVVAELQRRNTTKSAK